MTLAERLYSQGRRLFASRSVMPLVLLPFILLALPESAKMAAALGETWRVAVQWTALLIALSGLLLRCVTVSFAPDGTSSRDTRGLRAPSLNSTGVYSVVRHPLYLGAGLMWIGVAMSLRVWWLVVIVGLCYWLYIERVAIAEEAFLQETFGDQFRQWAARTPAFIPRVSLWRPRQAMAFQAKRLLSEHNGLLAVALLVTGLQYLSDRLTARQPWAVWSDAHPDLVAFTIFAIAVSVVCILVRRSPWIRDRAAGNAAHPTTVES